MSLRLLPVVPSVLAVLWLAEPGWAAPQGWTTADGKTIEVPEGASLELGDDLPSALDALLRAAVAAESAGFALTVYGDGEVLFSSGYGLADLERSVDCSPDSVFDMASVSKSVTAAAIATLASEGKIDLDASVRTYLSELSEVYEPVTLRHLVHHTGGVEDVQGMLALAGWGPGDPGTFDDALRVIGGLEHLRFTPGETHMYSNGGYLLLAAVVRAVTGTALPDFARERFFEPLEMQSAQFADGSGRLVPNRALPYALTDGEIVRASESTRYGAGGLMCSVADLAKWAEALRSGELLDGVRDSILQPGVLADGAPIDYAFGLSRSFEQGRVCWSHGGSVPGGQSFLAFYPEHGVSVVAASNTLEEPNVARLAMEAAKLVLGPAPDAPPAERPRMIMLTGNEERPAESEGVEVDAETVAAYGGVYEMEEEGFVLTVGAREERLLIGFGDAPEFEIFPLPSGAFLLPSANYEFRFDPEQDSVVMHVRQSARTGQPMDIGGKRRVLKPLDERSRAAIVGTYCSRELGAYYAIVWDDDALWLDHARHGRMALTRLTADEFTIPGHSVSRLTLVRDEGGTVQGFDLQAYSWAASSHFERR